ncbi:hypothetical protein F750_7069 (plasmid) [Streptomyces sp. PAMC 26508]|nr:hypothetical protein F750_7069 [Streptomyces sp. PAMC 26508]
MSNGDNQSEGTFSDHHPDLRVPGAHLVARGPISYWWK